MEVIYAGEDAPASYRKALFLAGPTPRDQEVESWRPTMLQCLEFAGYDGVVFVPEARDGVFKSNYEDQAEWEKRHMRMADLIVFWVPREITKMPAFTTNVEFGLHIDGGKLLYGRPGNSPKNRYLDWLYADRGLGKVHDNLISLARAAKERLGDGVERTRGERYVPLHIWSTPAFQGWHQSQKTAGNVLEEVDLLWIFNVCRAPFSFALGVTMWISSEERWKDNEFVLSRSDISTILAYRRHPSDPLESKIVMVREFRVPARTDDGFIHELPGGSSFKRAETPLEVAAHELAEETGIVISLPRFREIADRQLAGTFSSHKGRLFAVELTYGEMAAIEARNGQRHGVVKETECTYVEVSTVKELLRSGRADWSTLGMVFQGLFDEQES